MKLLDIFPVALVLWFANQLVESKITCSKNQYIVVKNGTESCLACNPCVHGFGLSPPCGSKVDHPPPIDCVPCVPGKTYSNEYGPSSCKNCHLCSAKEIVTRNCTTTENTICSNTCEEGYYYENSTHDCQLCSECCNKGNDIVIKECKSMPPNKQCSALSAKKCKPKPTNVIFTAYSRTTKGTSSNSGPKKPNNERIAYSIVGAVVGVILIIVLIFLFKRIKKTKKGNINRNATYNSETRAVMMEDGAEDDSVDEPYQCDLNHMQLKTTNHSPDQLSEGQKISLSINCDNQNGDIKEDNRKCNFGFEWKKDGDSMPKNIYHKCSKNLIIDNVEVADSGRYYCEIHCCEHPNHKKKSSIVEIHVEPGEGTELKLFTDLDWNVQVKIANSLKPKTVGIGNWMDLGIKFGIEEDALKALDNDKAPSEVLENIKCHHPELTVLDFCETMKSMKQNKIVIFLKDQLTNKPKEPTKSAGTNGINRPDSGYIAEELDSDGPLQVDLPPVKVPVTKSKPSHLMIPALVNLGHADSSRETSRESSVEDLTSSFLPTLQNFKPVEEKGFKKFLRRKKSGDSQNCFDDSKDLKEDHDEDDGKPDPGKKSRYGRQISKDSQKSDDMEDFGTRERKRSRSSSIASSIKEMVLKQPSIEYSALGHHHEESDEGV